jgi:hypothetical protein
VQTVSGQQQQQRKQPHADVSIIALMTELGTLTKTDRQTDRQRERDVLLRGRGLLGLLLSVWRFALLGLLDP